MIGITKAYVTRVGAGPFPTEDLGPGGRAARRAGHEFGVTTGRQRRCGWFDAVVVRYAARLNGLTELFVTKLDVLSGFRHGEGLHGVPRATARCSRTSRRTSRCSTRAEPVYEELEGWDEDLGDARSFGDLPAAARKYLDRLQELARVPIGVVSVGPAREQSLPRRDPSARP